MDNSGGVGTRGSDSAMHGNWYLGLAFFALKCVCVDSYHCRCTSNETEKKKKTPQILDSMSVFCAQYDALLL